MSECYGQTGLPGAKDDAAVPGVQQAMTGLYWTAAVLALMWAGYTAVRLRRDRSALVATSLLCMASAAAAMGVAAAWPSCCGPSPLTRLSRGSWCRWGC